MSTPENPTPTTRTRARRYLPLTIAAVAIAAVSAAGVILPAADAADSAKPSAAIQKRVDRLVSDDHYPGVRMLVRQKDGRTVSYTAGYGDLRARTPIPSDPRVRVASNTKTFTSTVVLQLVGERKVSLDAPIEDYLPGVVRGPGGDGRQITVRQLLRQQSGLPGYDSLAQEGLLAVRHRYFEPYQLVRAALEQPAQFAPGTSWAYSNTNYVLAGLLVQAVTGRPVGEEITRRIIEPLHLRDTSWPTVGDQSIPSPHPRGYLREKPGSERVDVTSIDPSLGWAAGQLISSPRDMITFSRALLSGDLLRPAERAELTSTVDAPEFEPEKGWRYGLGFASKRLSCGVLAWGHGGDIQGFETRGLTTSDGRSVFIVANQLPTSVAPLRHLNAAVEAAACGDA